MISGFRMGYVLLLVVALLGSTACTQGDREAVVSTKFPKVTYAYKSVDGNEILADVYATDGPKGPRPTVLWIHGGGLVFGTRSWMPEDQLERYLAAGYVVVAMDHRLVPETKIPQIIEDLKDAYAWIRTDGPELFNADPENIAVVGHSSGGYLALTSGFVLSPRPQAVIAVYGFGDLTGDWTVLPNPYFLAQPEVTEEDALAVVGQPGISSGDIQYRHDGRPTFFRYTKQQGNWTYHATGEDPKTNPEWFSAYEPARNVDAGFPPTLLIHGEKDTDVPFEQSIEFARVLKEYDVEYQLIINPDWEHLFDLNQTQEPEVQQAFYTMATFLGTYLDAS